MPFPFRILLTGALPFMILESNSADCASTHRRYWPDLLIALLLASLTAGLSRFFGRQMPYGLYTVERAGNVWFQADPGRVVADMVYFGANHYRTKVHPLFVLLTFPFGTVLRYGLGVSGLRAAQMVIVGVSFIFAGAFFSMLRLMGNKRLDAALYTLLCIVSSSTLFGLTVIETYPFGAISILLALMVVVISQKRQLSSWWMVAASALTLAYTVTNWMAGLLATVVSRPRREWRRIILSAFLLVTLLWGVQKVIFRSSRFFIGSDEELHYMLTDASGGPSRVTVSFWSHTMIMPAIDVIENNTRWEGMWPRMSVQRAQPGSASLWGEIGVGLWLALLLLGIVSLLSVREQRPLRIVLAGFILGQWAMHIIYGEETILYAMHYAPPMILVVALASHTKLRPAALALTALLIPCAALNNISLLRQAITVPRDHSFILVPSQLSLGGGWNGWGIGIGAGIGAIVVIALLVWRAVRRERSVSDGSHASNST